MSQIVPLEAVPNQTFAVALADQNVQLNIYQKGDFLYMDVFLNNEAVILAVICQNLNRIVRNRYLGFLGDFMFYDTQGSSDPEYTGLENRYVLYYVLDAELPEE